MSDRPLRLRIRTVGVLLLLATAMPAVLFLAWPATVSAQEPPQDPVTITSFGKVDPNPVTHPQPTDKVDGEFEVRVSFNRPVTGFTADDFDVDHGSTSDLSVSNGNWTVTVTVDTGYEGPLTVTLPENAVDEGNAEKSLSFTVDQTAPAAELSVPSHYSRPIAPWFYTYLTFSEPVKLGEDSDTGLLADILLQKSDLTLTDGRVIRLQKVSNDESGRLYRAYVQQGTHEGDYTITLPAGVVQDDVGNPNPEATITVQVDGLSPTVEITGPESGYVQKGASFDVTFQFSEAVTGFTEGDITVTGGTLTASSLASSGTNAWTASVAVSADADEVAVEVRATAVHDAARRVNATTKATFDAVDPPTAVRDILLEYSRDGELGVSWIGPADDGGAPIVDYQYRYGPGTGDDVEYTEWESTGVENSGDPKRDIELTGLTNGTQYSVQMRALNAAAAGPFETFTGRPNPKVTVRTSAGSITEGDSATFTLTRTGATTNALTVDVCSKLLTGGDCTVRTTTVTFSAGSETATHTVTTQDNEVDDPHRRLVVTVLAQDTAPYTYSPGDPDEARVTVRDDDNAIVSILPQSHTTVEEGDPATFTLGRDGLVTERLRVKVSVSETGAYLTDSPPVWADFPPGHATTTFSVPTKDDDLAEDDGTITVTIVAGSDWRVAVQNTASRTVTSEDKEQLVTIAHRSPNVSEGGYASFVLTRKQINDDDTTDADVSGRGSLTVTVALTEEVPDEHTPRYTTGNERTVTFAAGVSTATLWVLTAENSYNQPNGSVTATPVDGDGYRTPAENEDGYSATVTIFDDDGLPRVSITAAKDAVDEGEDVVFTLTRSGNTTRGLKVELDLEGLLKHATTETKALMPREVDLGAGLVEGAPQSVRLQTMHRGDWAVDFAPGSDTATLTLTTVADQVPEGDGYFKVDIQQKTTAITYYTREPSSATVLVRDNDTTTLTLEVVDPPDAVEGRPYTYEVIEYEPQEYRVARTGDTTHRVSYRYRWYRDPGLGPGGILDKERISTGATAEIETDASFFSLYGIPEDSATFNRRSRVTGVAPGGGEQYVELLPGPVCDYCPRYEVGTPSAFRILIANRSAGVSIEADAASVEEGGSVTYTLTRIWVDRLLRYSGTHVDLHFDDPDGVISGTPPRTVVIPRGETTATFTLTMADDDEDGPDRRLVVSVAAPVDPGPEYTGDFEAVAPHAATVTVTDNDDPPLPTVTVAERKGRTWVSEAAGEIEFVVARSGGSGALVVHLDVARQGSFFPSTPAVPSSVTIEAGKKQKILRIPVVDDAVVEPSGSVTVSIEARSSYVRGDPSSARVDVLDNEAYFVIADATVEEGDDDGHGNPVDSVDVTVTFVGQSVAGSLASVDWATQDGTAEANADYTAKSGAIEVAAGTCKVPPGSPTCTYKITVPIIDDSVDEADETFKIVLSNPDNANALPYGTVTIVDDDDATATVSIETVEESDVPESAEYVEFLLTLSEDSQNTVEVDWRTSVTGGDNAATAGQDYTATKGTAVFPRGTTEQRIRVAIRDDDIDEDSETLAVQLTAARNAERSGNRDAYGWIRDDDVRGVSAAPATLSIAEGSTGDYTLVLDSRPTDDVTVAVIVPADSDLSAAPSTLTFTPYDWDQPQTVTLTAAADADDVADAPVDITHTAGGGDYGPAPTDSVTVTITGDAGATLSVADAEAPEGAGAIVFTVTLTGRPSSQVTVAYATSNGTATAGQDYTSTSGTLTFAAGAAGTRTVSVPVTDDSDGEEDETFTLTLSGEANATLAVATATGTILDDDAGFAVTGERVAETAGEIVFTVTRQGSTSDPASVSYATRDGTALAGSDYTARTGRITFARGESSKTVSVPVTNDLLDEPDEETFTFRLSGPAGTVIAAGKGTAAGVIVDDDRTPRLFFEFLLQSAEESAGPISFTVKLSAASGRRVEVDYTTRETPGQAKAGSDFTAVDGTLVFAPGETEKTITVQLVDDDVAESVETFGLVLHDAVNASISSGEAAAIISDKDLYNVTVTAREEKVSEGSALVFDVWRDGDTSRELVVTLGRTVEQVDDPCDPEEASSCERDDVTVTFKGAGFNDGEPGQSRVAYRWKSQVDPSAGAGKGFAYTVTVKADSREPAQYRPGTPASASTAVASTGVLMVLAYEKMDPLWAQQGDEVSVKWTVINLSNTAATDVKVKTDRTEGTHDCADSLPGPSDDDEYSSCTVTAAYAATAADVTAGKLTINASVTKTAGAESNAVQVVFPQGDGHTLAVRNSVPADEYSNRSALFFKVSLNEPSTETVTVAYATSDGTATGNTAGATSCGGIGVNFVSGFDYIPASGTLTFDPGDTEELVRVQVCDDHKPEANETVIFTISSPSGGTLDADRSAAVGIILDNDQPATNPSITFAMVGGDNEVAENAGYAEFTLTLSGGTNDTVTVGWAATALAADDARAAATVGMDYTAAGGTVTFPPRTTELRIRVPILNDMMDEDALEYLQVALSDPVNATITAPSTIDLAIRDDDKRGVTVFPNEMSLDEGDSGTYSVSLNSQPAEAEGVTVAVSLQSNGGVSVAPASLTFTQDNWRNAQVVTVTGEVDDDSTNSPYVIVTNRPSGSDYDGMHPAVVQVTVLDRPVLMVADKTVAENAGSVTVEVTLDRTSNNQAITVDWKTVDGTAKAGRDYTPAAGTLTFAADDASETISLTITDDSLDEDAETFSIALSNVSGNAGIGGPGTVTITDNDAQPTVTIAEVGKSSEASGEGRFRVRLSDASGRQVTVEWLTTDFGTATANADYVKARGTLTFEPAEQQKDFNVVIVDDAIVEEREIYRVKLRNPVNATLHTPPRVDAEIIDNDEAGVLVQPTAVDMLEGGTGEYTLRLKTLPTADVTITVTVPANTDLTASPTSLTFTSSNWDQPQTVTLTAAEDADLADDEVSLTHAASGGGYGNVSVDGVTATIVDNDFPTLSIADGEADEDDGSIEFTVTLSQAGGKDIAVSWSTTDGTASGGTDYSAVTAGSLTIPAGDTTATLTVTVLDDGVVEPDETFTVTLADPVNATLADATATGTINNDDEIAVTVEPTALTIGEGGSDLYRVSIGSQPTGGDVTVVVTVPSDTDVSAGPTTLTFTAGNWRWPQYVVVNTLSDDDAVADAPVTLTHAVSGGGYGSVTASAVTVTITEENERGVDVSPTTLSLDEGESGVYSVVLRSQPTANVTVTITVPADAGATVDKTSLTFTSDNWDDAQEVEVSATEDDDASSPEPFTITHAVSGGDYASESADSVTVTVDDTTVTMLVFQGSDILTEGVKAAESAGTMAFVVSLQIESGETVTVNYSTSNGTATAGSDYTRTAGRLTFSAGETTKTISVPVLNDRVDEDDETFTLTLSNAVNADLSGGESSLSVEGTIEDDDERGLVLSSDTIGVPEGERRTYTVVLKSQPTQSVHVTLEVPPGAEFSVNTRKLAFTPSNWNTPQNVIVNAYQDRDAQPDPKAAIEHTAVGGDYGNPRRSNEFPNVTASMDVIVLEDDEPTVTLSLDPDTISEDGGVATVTASLSEQSSAETTIVVSIDPTDTSTLGSNTTLTIAANQTTSTGEVTITAVNDSAYAGDRQVTVSGSAENTAGVGGPDDVTLTIAEDDDLPQVTLVLTPATISESGSANASTVTATLSEQSTAATTVTVSIDPTDTSTLSSNTTLTIAKGTTSSTGEVTITATDDSTYTGNREVTVSGSAENTAGVDGPDDVTLTITDDDAKPVVTLALDSDSISENAGVATVTASLDKQSTAATTVTVSIDPTDTSTLSSNTTLTIAKGTTSSTGEVTITATDDSAYTGNREVTVSGSAENTAGVDGPDDVTLTITDDDAKPVVTLALDSDSISENAGVATVTASLDKQSTAATTVTVSIDPTDTSTLSSNVTLTIAKGETASTGEVTITATDDSAYTGNREVTVSGSAENTAGVDGPDDVTLTITDDDAKPVVTLALDPDSISENAGVATVTASLDKQSTAATTVTVSIDPTDTSTLSSNVTLTIAKGETASTGEVTITATDDSAYTGNREVTVSGSAENTAGVDGPDDVTLTITDDDAKPVVTLALDPDSISENAGVATVTASLDKQSTAATTVTVSIDPTDTSTLSSNVTLTIAKGETASTGEVTITATDDSAYTGNREVTVSGSAENTAGVDGPDDVTLTITDDDAKPVVTLALDPDSISENAGVATVTASLDKQSTAATTVTVSIDPTDTSTLSSNVTLTIAKGETASTGEVTITATDDSAYTGNREVTVSGSAENTAGVDGPDDVTLTITDDDAKPVVTLALDPDSISENAGVATVTASLDKQSTAATTVTVSIDPTDTSTLSSNVTLTIAKGETASTGEVTITATDDSAYTGNREVTVSGSAENTAGVDGPDDVTLTITDDDAKPVVTLALDPDSISENAGVATVTASLDKQSTAATTVTVSIDPTDTSTLSSNVTLTIAKGETASTGEVTITATDDSAYTGNREVTVSGSAENTAGVDGPEDVTLTITDDDAKPVVTLALDPDSISENAGVATVTASLDKQSTAATTVTVSIDPTDTSTLSSNVTLTIAKGETASTGEVTITATDDSAYTGNREVTVSGSAENTAGVDGPDDVTLTITDDDAKPVVTLALDPDSISENAGVATVTASLDKQSTAATTVTVSIDPTDTSTLSSNVTLTIAKGETASTGEVTITATDDSAYTGNREVTVSGSAENTAGVDGPDDVTLTITDDDAKPVVTLALDPDSISENAGVATVTASLDKQSTAATTVTVSIDPTDTSTLSSNVTLTIAKGETASTGEVTITATDDSAYTGNREVTVSGSAENTAGVDGPEDVTLTITDDEVRAVTASFESATYTAAEGGSATVKVTLSVAPERQVVVPITKTNKGGASSADYSGVPASLTFGATDTAKTFTFSATADNVDDDGESVVLAFGTLPTGVSAGTTSTSTVSITDDDVPAVKVNFESATYTAAEGGSATVKVTLSVAPERQVVVPLTKTNKGGASSADYSGVPANLTFGATDTAKTFTFSATADDVDDDDESVALAFGSLPTGVSAGTTSTSTVSITDDDVPAVKVNFESATYTAAEGGSATVKVTLSVAPERQVVVPLTKTNKGGASSADYSGVPSNLTFGASDTEKSFTFSATADDVDDDGESVVLAFGTLPTGVSAGTTSTSTVSITDDDVPAVKVNFESATYTAAEGGSATVKVTLSVAPERQVVVPITKTNKGGASSADYSGVPANLTFGATDTAKTFTFSATADDVDDDGESVVLAFGTLPTGVSAGTTSTSTVSITDDDVPAVKVNFESATYTAAEGGSATVKVTLSVAPERQVVVPLTKTNKGGASSADYSGVPANLTFGATDTAKTFTFSATADDVDDDDESVALAFGSLPTGVSAGTTSTSTVSITDDDVPAVKVNFESATYTAAEGGSATVKVTLSVAPERQVVIPLTKTNQGGASSADYSGVPSNLTFGASDTEKSFTFSATADNVDDDDESVALAFGSLPTGVSAGTTSTSTVSITDDDVPSVTVSFEQSAYTAAEGGSATVKVTLSPAPERQVVVPLTKTNQGGASSADYSGVPSTLTFGASDTEKSFTFSATADNVDDDDESVALAFGSLPTGVSAGTTSTSTVSITDDDVPSVTVSFEQSAYTAAEGGSATVKVTLSPAPERQVVVPLTKTNQGGASSADYSGVPSTLTFGASDTEKSFTFSATADDVDDDDESVLMSFGALPTGVSAGTTPTSTVSIADDDVPAVTVSFEHASYSVIEGDTVDVKVTLSAAPERQVVVPIATTNQDGASAADYSGVPSSLTFGASDTEKTFSFSATEDSVQDPGESVDLSLGVLPTRISAGTTSTSTVSITDVFVLPQRDAEPQVTLVLTPATINKTGSGNSSTVTAMLSAISSAVTTVVVSVDPTDTTTLSANRTLTIAAGKTASTGEVTITALDHDAGHGPCSVTVSGSANNNAGVDGPEDTTLTITDGNGPNPHKPANFRVTSEKGKTTFHWDQVGIPCAAERLRYDILVREPGGSEGDWEFTIHTDYMEESTDDDQSPLTWQRLPVGGTYEFAIQAVAVTPDGSPLLSGLVDPVTLTVRGPNLPWDVKARRTDNGVEGPVELTWERPLLYSNRPFYEPAIPIADPDAVDTTVYEYIIFRADKPEDDGDMNTPPDHGATYSQIAIVGDVTTYIDETVAETGSYFYRVQARSTDGTSDRSGYAFAYGLPGSDDGDTGQRESTDESNSPPSFGSSTYSFSIAEDAATGDAVGTVSATDADSDGITYTIEAGSGDGKFAIDGSNGAITVAGALDHETTPSYTLTVQADDGEGGTDTATVNVTVTDVVESTTGPLAGFTLVDASNQSVLASLTNGATVALADPNGGSYGIRADIADGETVGSVRLELSGGKTVSQTESSAPYSLYGDEGENALHGEALPAGSYTLRATAYSEGSGSGEVLGVLEVSFTVTDGP